MPTGAQFADPDLAAALTCQGLYQRGLGLRQFKEMVTTLKVHHYRSQCPQNSRELHMFWQWQRAAGLHSLFSIGEVESEEDMQFLHEKLKLRPEMIEYYLAHHLLAKVKRYTTQVNSTAADLNGGGCKSILFSATLGLAEEYPALDMQEDGKIKRTHLSDFQFQAAAIQQACAPHNQESYWLTPPQEPKLFFEQLLEQNRNLFNDAEGIIDVAGMLRYASTEKIALDFLQFSEEHKQGYEGAVFIREEATGEATVQIILVDKNKRTYVDVKGSDILSALKNQGFKNPEQVRLFKIFGPSQATGTDMFLSKKAKMLLTADSEGSLWDQIQAMMRCRGFLEPTVGQRIVWIGDATLREKIASKYSIKPTLVTPKHMMQWYFEREVKKAKPRVLLQACQAIVRVIRSSMETVLDTKREWVKQHTKGIFSDEIPRNLAMQYACTHSVEQITVVLRRYVSDLLNQAGVQLKDIPGAQRKIEAIIQEAQRKIPQTTTGAHHHSTSTVQAQQQQQQQQQHQVQQQTAATVANTPFVPLPRMDYAGGELACNSPQLLSIPNRSTFFSANQLFPSSLFYEHLYLLGNVVKSDQTKEISLKTIDFVLVVLGSENGDTTPRFYCVSHEDARDYAVQLAGGAGQKGCHMALCTSMGTVVQNGAYNGIGDDQWKELKNNNLWQNILHQLALLNGEVMESAFFKEKLVSGWLQQGIPVETIKRELKGLCGQQCSPHEGEYLLSLLEEEMPSPVVEIPAPIVLSDTRPSTDHKVISVVMTLLAVVLSVALALLATLSLMGGHWAHAPPFTITLYKTLPLWVTYTAAAVSVVIALSLVAYHIVRARRVTQPI